MNSRGQGTIEYLVIIAIVVVISLVVVALMLSIFENSGDVVNTADIISTQTLPVALKEAILGVGEDANGLIVITNNTGDLIKNVRIKIDGKDHNYFDTQISLGSSKTFRLNDLNIPCDEDETSVTKTITIIYTTRSGIEKTQKIEDIKVTCATTNNPTPTKTPTEEKQQEGEAEVEILDFRISGIYEGELGERGAAFSLKNNLPAEVLITEIRFGDLNLEYEIDGINENGGHGFTIMNRFNDKVPRYTLALNYPDLVDLPIIESGETRGFAIRSGSLVGCSLTNGDGGGESEEIDGIINLQDCNYVEIKSKNIGESQSFDVFIKYEYNEGDYETQLQTVTGDIESVVGMELVSYYRDPFDISEIRASADNQELGSSADRAIGFIFTNVLDDDVEINSLSIKDTDESNEYEFFPTIVTLSSALIENWNMTYGTNYPYRLVKVTDGSYPNGAYIEANPPINNPILFESGEENGLFVDHGTITDSLEDDPVGTIYAPHYLNFNITYKGDEYDYEFYGGYNENFPYNIIAPATETEGVIGMDLFTYYSS